MKERKIYLTWNFCFTIWLMRKYRNICSYWHFMTSVKYIFVVVSINQTQNEMLIYFLFFKPGNECFPKKPFIHIVGWFMIHIYMEISLVNNLWLCNTFVYFSLKIIQKIRFMDIQLQRQQKSTDLMMHHNLTQKVLSTEKITRWRWWDWNGWYKGCN